VKEGTERSGAIESVVRLVRKTVRQLFCFFIFCVLIVGQLLTHEPPVPLAPKRRVGGSEWVLIDGGTFAIHIVSKAAREKYFSS